MRKPPALQDWLNYPVTSVVALLAILATLAWKSGMDISFMFMDSEVWHGQLWRLVTSAFPHVDLIHIAFNLYWLWVFGTLVEGVFGSYRTATILVLFAAGSAAAQYAVSVGGVGLSGVGYGLFGLLWVLSRRDSRFRDAVDNQTIGLFVVWFFLCIFLTHSHVWNVGNAAHGLGAILGALLGFCIVSEETVRRLVGAVLCLVILADFLLASFGRSYLNFSSNSWEESAFRVIKTSRIMITKRPWRIFKGH
jgi:membrane associated rhomboid family serine protease